MTLQLARAWYGLVGAVTLLMTAGHVSGAVTGGSRFDPPIVAGGVAIGLLAVAATVWVTSRDRMKGALVWTGIAAVAVAFLIALGIAVTSAGIDAVLFIGLPTVVALAAAARMAWAHRPGRAHK